MTPLTRPLCLCLALVASACASVPAGSQVERAQFLMGTTCRIEVAASENAAMQIDAAFAEIGRIEALLSTWRDDSLLSRLNRAPVGQPFPTGEELAELLRLVAGWSERTGGAFDPAVAQLVRAWDLRGEGRRPTPAELDAARARGRITDLRFGSGSVTRTADVQIEEGGFGKGYALDRAIEKMRVLGAREGLIDFGGQIVMFGTRERIVDVADPRDRTKPCINLVVTAGSVSTSSGSEQGFGTDAERFTHILDPRTGMALPPRGSATVIHPSALVADILSTALYVLGPDAAIDWANQHGIAAVVIVPRSNTLEIRSTRSAEAFIARNDNI